MRIPDNYLQIKHLYHRAGFGIKANGWKRLIKKQPSVLVDQLFRESRQYDVLDVIDFELPDMREVRQMDREDRQELVRKSRQYIRRLNVAWIAKMAEGKAMLREKIALFWHDHFACQPRGIRQAQQYVNTLRKHALGNFGDLLTAISKEPAMLQFLNNQQNRKAHPNENFAREVLELFTMGRGHYSEIDIKEAARAFTGWGFNTQAEFVFRKGQHDFGQKTFLGEKGNWDGDDILKMILEKRRTAYYITEKLYRFLVNSQVEEAMVKQWADLFYNSGYDIGALVKNILMSEHFYESQYIGKRIKSPVEYLVGLMRQLDLRFKEGQSILFVQQLLGQVLFQPPNVAGWPEGISWIDSNSLMTRLHLPRIMLSSLSLDVDTKDSFAGNEDSIGRGAGGRKLQVEVDWEALKKTFGQTISGEMSEGLASFFIQLPLSTINPAIMNNSNTHSKESSLLHQSLKFICTPEYQMC